MCRWMVYKGQEVLLAEVVTRPSNSIIHQSRHSPYLPYLQGTAEEIKARNHAINGDGFGVAWYDHICPEGEPCVFTSVQPSWHCTNLQSLANHIRTHCIFAHVRAASPGSLISQSNCHPFKFGRLLFMHNGGIAHFDQVKYSILHTIRHTSASYVRGTTDSEHAGALFVHYLGDPSAVHDGHALKEAMLKMMAHLVGLIRWQESQMSPHQVCEGHMPSSLNFAVTDGRVVIATRYRDSKEQDPPSLYFSEAQQMHMNDEDGVASPLCWKYPSTRLIDSIVISSEPLTKDESAWKLVPRNHLLVVTNRQRTIIEPIHLRTLHSSSDSVDIFEPDASATELAAAGKWDESQAASELAGSAKLSSPSGTLLQPSPPASSQAGVHTRRHSNTTASSSSSSSYVPKAKEAKKAAKRSASTPHVGTASVYKPTGRVERQQKQEPQQQQQKHTDTGKKNRDCGELEPKAGEMKEKAAAKEKADNIWIECEEVTKVKREMRHKEKMQQQQSEKDNTSRTEAVATLRSLVDFWRGFATGLCLALLLLALVFMGYLGTRAADGTICGSTVSARGAADDL